VLLLTADHDLAESLSELLALNGLHVTAVAATAPVQAVVADLDAWPPGWDLRLLRLRWGRLPCMLLSASPFAGPYTASRLRRGYFLPKPLSPRRFLALLRRCLREAPLGC
jgi:hypothetical protein